MLATKNASSIELIRMFEKYFSDTINRKFQLKNCISANEPTFAYAANKLAESNVSASWLPVGYRLQINKSQVTKKKYF